MSEKKLTKDMNKPDTGHITQRMDTPHAKIKNNLLEQYGDQFDRNRTINMSFTKEGGVEIEQEITSLTEGQMQKIGELISKKGLSSEDINSIAKQLFPNARIEQKKASISPDELKSSFEKLSKPEQDKYSEGLQDSIDGARYLIRGYEEILTDQNTSPAEKEEAQKNIDEQNEALAINQKVYENLKKS